MHWILYWQVRIFNDNGAQMHTAEIFCVGFVVAGPRPYLFGNHF